MRVWRCRSCWGILPSSPTWRPELDVGLEGMEVIDVSDEAILAGLVEDCQRSASGDLA